MKTRLDLDNEIRSLGIPNVYFQPPENEVLKFPCIIYTLTGVDTDRADNMPYLIHGAYSLIYVDKNPDSPMIFEILKRFENIRYERQYKANNRYHNAYNLYY